MPKDPASRQRARQLQDLRYEEAARQLQGVPQPVDRQLGLLGADAPDPRDWLKPTLSPKGLLPVSSSLMEHFGVQRNQGQTNACTGHAMAELAEILVARLGGSEYRGRLRFSPSFSYHFNRLRSGSQGRDVGAYLRDSLKALMHDGVVAEAVMPTDVDPLTPPTDAQLQVARWRLKGFERVEVNLEAPDQVQRILEEEKLPLAIGLKVFAENTQGPARRTGLWAYPGEDDNWWPYGSHAMTVVAYRPNPWTGDLEFGALHHWGPGVGRDGLAWIDAQYFSNSYLLHDMFCPLPTYW